MYSVIKYCYIVIYSVGTILRTERTSNVVRNGCLDTTVSSGGEGGAPVGADYTGVCHLTLAVVSTETRLTKQCRNYTTIGGYVAWRDSEVRTLRVGEGGCNQNPTQPEPTDISVGANGIHYGLMALLPSENGVRRITSRFRYTGMDLINIFRFAVFKSNYYYCIFQCIKFTAIRSYDE